MISIIVAIYNVEKFLRNCLDSIRNQDFEDFEAILVDDGSTDSSGIICDEFQEKDNRFKSIHQSNQGVSAARNTGLSMALGEYISFVDGDDYIHPKYLSTLFNAIKQTGCKVSCLKGKIVNEYLVPSNEIIREPRILSQDYMIKNMFLSSAIDVQYLALWNKLYCKSIIKDLRFKRIISEDGEFNIQVYLRVSKIAYIDASLYYWIQHENSLTHGTYLSKRFVDELQPYYLYSDYIPKENLRYRAYFLEKLFKRILNILYHAKGTKFEKYAKSETQKAKLLFIDEFKENPYISKKMKTVLLSFIKYPPLYSLFIWINEKKALMMKKTRLIYKH